MATWLLTSLVTSHVAKWSDPGRFVGGGRLSINWERIRLLIASSVVIYLCHVNLRIRHWQVSGMWPRCQTRPKNRDRGQQLTKDSDTLESFLSKVSFESNYLRKKLSRIEHVLIVKVSFERRKIAKVFMTHVQVFFRKSLSKATFERKRSSVSLALALLFVIRDRGQQLT